MLTTPEALNLLAAARDAKAACDRATNSLSQALHAALTTLLPVGMVIDRTARKVPEYLFSVKTMAGNDRGTHLFRIEKLVCVNFSISHPALSRWEADATPISEVTGKDMKASAGNKGRTRSTVRLVGQLGGFPDDPDSDVVLGRILALAAANKEAVVG